MCPLTGQLIRGNEGDDVFEPTSTDREAKGIRERALGTYDQKYLLVLCTRRSRLMSLHKYIIVIIWPSIRYQIELVCVRQWRFWILVLREVRV